MNKLFSCLLTTGIIFAALTSSISEAGKREHLARVFSPDMLSADLPYFEQVTGPARNTRGNTKIYLLDGCEVAATVINGSVHTLRVELSSKCTFDLNKFLQASLGRFPPPHKMTFGQFDALTNGGGRFMADCLVSCGNAADPVIYEYRSGSHADLYLDVMLEAVQAEDGVLAAANMWQDSMKNGEGENWVLETKFNCKQTKYDEVAHKVFKNAKITAITVGYAIETPMCQ